MSEPLVFVLRFNGAILGRVLLLFLACRCLPYLSIHFETVPSLRKWKRSWGMFFRALRHDKCLCSYRVGHLWEVSEMICIDFSRYSLTQSFVAQPGDHWKAWVIQSEITLSRWRGMLSHAWVNMYAQYHKVEVCFCGNPAVRYQNIHCLQCHISPAAQGCCPVCSCSCSFYEHCHTCLTKQQETSCVQWNMLIRITCGFFCGCN